MRSLSTTRTGSCATCSLSNSTSGPERSRDSTNRSAHAERFVESLDRSGPLVELLKEQVAHDPMRVVDKDLIRAAVVGTENGRVGVAGHEQASALVVGAARKDILWVGDARHALHVDGNEYLHGASRQPLTGPNRRCSLRPISPAFRACSRSSYVEFRAGGGDRDPIPAEPGEPGIPAGAEAGCQLPWPSGARSV